MLRPYTSTPLAILGLVAWIVGTSATAWGHGGAPGLAFYGDFNAATARCQRALGVASRACFTRALAAKQGCMETSIAGGTCDTAVRDAEIEAAKQDARARVAVMCDEIALGILQFAGLADVQGDLANACDTETESTMSIVYGPVSNGGAVSELPPERQACMQLVAGQSNKLIRRAHRERQHGLDSIAARTMPLNEREARMARATSRISRSRQRAVRTIQAGCGDALFADIFGKSITTFLDLIEARGNCLTAAGYVQSAVTCPAPVCGNGAKESGEECDDGNTFDDDVCRNECTKTNCSFFPNTYDLIQAAIFESKGCTNTVCHGSNTPAGGLDLRRGVSYDNLVDMASQISVHKRVEPGDKDRSFLWRKLAAATLGDIPDLEGSPMPTGLAPLTQNELEALRLWIYGGAPRTGVIEGAADLLDACSPAPDPVQIRPPDPPAAGVGVQMHMPRLAMPSQSETEVCFASYYDFTGLVPPEALSPDGKFRFKSRVETQDPLSHHLIIHSYNGQYGVDDPSWGAWTCKGGAKAGAACDPHDQTACGSDGVCGSEPKRTVACLGFGPSDYSATTAPSFGGSQEPVAFTQWSDGVFSELPLKGIVVWNSHAFNLTTKDAKVEAWVNFDFAVGEDQRYGVQGGILDPEFKIFIMNVPPFERRRYCHQFTFPQGARLFEITSHMHKRGKLFQIYKPNGTPEGELIYTSTQYNDPVQMTLPAPVLLDSPDPAERRYRYCAEYDNGATDPADVKRHSIAPIPPPPFPPVACTATHCTDGNVGTKCTGTGTTARDQSCDSSPAAGDGRCDACTLTGGVTTEDEMFLLIAYYYCDGTFPETCRNVYESSF